MSANRPVDDLIGKTLGQFEILEEIGRGGMATVYRARQKSINRVVALKVLPPSLLHDPSFYERFTREVDVIAHLEHPHIVPIYDYGEANGIPFIAMRYLAGGSIAAWLRKGLPTIAQIERPLSQVAQALDYAHLQGIIHRDLKPGNVLLDEHNNAYLTDFGIARVINSNLTGSAIIGTPAYMSPEQANGQPIDGRSDVYSLGIVLFEMLTGREPFYADTPLALMLKHLNEPTPSVREYRAELPTQIEWVVYKTTAKRPEERYQSAGDVARAFAEAVRIAPFEQGSGDHPTIPPTSTSRLTPPPMTPRPPTPPSTPGRADDRTITPANLTPLPRATPYPPPYDDRTLTPMPAALTPPSSDPPTMTDVGAAAAAIGGVAADRSTAEGKGIAPRTNPVVPFLIGGVILILIVLVGVVILLMQPSPPINLLPATPFPGAQTIEQEITRINVPAAWSQTQMVDEERRFRRWNDGDQAFFSLAIINASIVTQASFAYAIDRYAVRYYDGQEWLSEFDIQFTDDGWQRVSYHAVGGAPDSAFAPGQLDVFYLRRDPYLIVVETYTAYATGDTYVPTLQAVLDSLSINQSG